MKLKSSGLIDLHFHGAFGIDLMTARDVELTTLSKKLAASGIAAYCPTTLSDTPENLLNAVSRLGQYIKKEQNPKNAQAIGIHLEGPFLALEARGAHSQKVLRKVTFDELDALWSQSHETIKIITLAPENIPVELQKKLSAWCQKRKILLSIGHSTCTQKQAEMAFENGFSGVTHAWNAMKFHHRDAGILGAALTRSKVYLELIIDQIHVAKEVISMTCSAHSGNVCFISDCAPAAGLKEGIPTPFGNLTIEFKDGASRLVSPSNSGLNSPDSGALAGGGILLSESLTKLIQDLKPNSIRELKQLIGCATENPLKVLKISPKLLKFTPKIEWTLTTKRVDCRVLSKA